MRISGSVAEQPFFKAARLRTSEVAEPTPAPGKKGRLHPPGNKRRLRLLTLTFLI